MIKWTIFKSKFVYLNHKFSWIDIRKKMNEILNFWKKISQTIFRNMVSVPIWQVSVG